MPLLLVIFLALISPQPEPQLTGRFIGNMAVAISDGRATLISDFPYQSGYSVYMEYPASEIRSGTPVTVSLITHRHGDHWEPSLFRKTTWKVVGPADVVDSVDASRRVDPAATGIAGLAIQPIATPHANIGHYSYIVTWHGRRFYFTGDTEQLDALLAARNLDVAFVSPWLYSAAARRGAAIDAKRVIIYHHQAAEAVPQCTGTCFIPRQGDTFRF
jgi:L-ascorbate metabolism protein UlaG (beta-lactamase superfamily)